MRKKPVEEKRRFVASLSIFVMALITLVWFFLFFTGLPKRLEKQESPNPEVLTASVIEGAGKPAAPFSGN